MDSRFDRTQGWFLTSKLVDGRRYKVALKTLRLPSTSNLEHSSECVLAEAYRSRTYRRPFDRPPDLKDGAKLLL
jgi:hypothetical protein